MTFATFAFFAGLVLLPQQTQQQPSTRADIPRSATPTPPPVPRQFNAGFAGAWTGTLEYRDYSAKSPDAPHVKLPTELVMTPSPDGRAINFAYTYDDGPRKDGTRKMVQERTILAFTGNTALLTGTTSAENQVFQVAGGDVFARTGLGTLTLTGPGKENDKAADFRITLELNPTTFNWTKETRPADSGQDFVFRDAYHLTRK